MSRSKFFDKIRVSTIERQVEDCYNEGISFYFKETNGDPIKFTYPYTCDGIIYGGDHEIDRMFERKFEQLVSKIVCKNVKLSINENFGYVSSNELSYNKC